MTSGTKAQVWKAGYYGNKLWLCDTQYRMIPILNNSNKTIGSTKWQSKQLQSAARTACGTVLVIM